MYTMKMLLATLIVGLATVNAENKVTPIWTALKAERCLVQFRDGQPVLLLVFLLWPPQLSLRVVAPT